MHKIGLRSQLLEYIRTRNDQSLNKEVLQWEAQYDPDPANRMPQHIFRQLNEKLLKEKEEIKDALCKAKESMPRPVNYETKILKFVDALEALEDTEIPAKIKNEYLKNIIERINYERGPTVRITKENAHEYKTETEKGLQYYTPPYKIKISLKSD